MIHQSIQQPAKPRILVVDDVFENRSIVQRRLERMGYDCIVADSGAAALNMIRAMSPNLVLLDFMMPDMDGPMVLRELRASPATAKLPVIMLTARTDGRSVTSALDDGANDYVMKPIDFSVLKARIDSHLSRHEASVLLVEANGRLDARAAAQAVELGEVRELLHDGFRHDDKFAQLMDVLRRITAACDEMSNSGNPSCDRELVDSINRLCLAALAQFGTDSPPSAGSDRLRLADGGA